MKQVEGVFKAVCETKGQDSFDSKVELTTDERKQVLDLVTEGLASGEIEMSDRAREKYSDESKMRSYASGLVNNHLRKDTRLNGGEKYTPKNPGSRTGSSDPVIKNLKRLKSTLTDDEQIAAVQEQIDERVASLKAEKQKNVEIDAEQIPEELRHLIPQAQ